MRAASYGRSFYPAPHWLVHNGDTRDANLNYYNVPVVGELPLLPLYSSSLRTL